MPSEQAGGPDANGADAPKAAPTGSDALTEDELIAVVLSGAADRVREAVERLTQMGVIDESGKVVGTELARDMQPDSQTTVVTG
jgi:hypothetical protein